MIDFSKFFIDGYIQHYDENIDINEFEKYSFQDCRDENSCNYHSQNKVEKHMSQLQLGEVHRYLADTYVSKLFTDFQFKECDLWSGVDDGSKEWHNDHIDGDPFNTTFLIYLDDNTPENGNYIAVRGPDTEITLYPKRGDFIWLNQNRMFEHKAKHNSGQRRVLGFEFYIPALC